MSTNAAQEAENLEIEQVEARINADRNLNKNRRYVGTKETLAYIIYDISASFNISKYNDVFITDIVQIGLRFQTIVTFVIGIWDVINDIFLAAIIDRTRTRFGSGLASELFLLDDASILCRNGAVQCNKANLIHDFFNFQ